MAWTCKCGCFDCCGIVPMRKELVKEHESLGQRDVQEVLKYDEEHIAVVTTDGMCVFLTPENKCAIYDDRPQICRDYGQIDELQCPYIKMNGNPRSVAGAKRMQRKINHQIDATFRKICGRRLKK